MTITTVPATEKNYGSRGILALAGIVAIAIAATILLAPGAFYSGYGIDVAGNPTLANELKAPSGALLVAGIVMFAGVVRRSWLAPALATAAIVYLSYGFGRFISIALDGMPHTGMVSAAVIEVVIGALCANALLRIRRSE